MSYTLSGVLALGFHALVVVLLMVNWENEESLAPIPLQPYYIDASVVGENPFEAEKKEQARRKGERKLKETARRDREAQNRANQAAVERAKLEDLEKRLAAENAEREARQKQALEQLDSLTNRDTASPGDEKERLKREQSLALSILEEQSYRRAVTDDEKAMAFVGQIQRDIVGNWSRPPSARNGMQAVLRVYLVPTGEVVNVVVEESSGNDAFDRSALLAVQKAERFQVPPDSRQFERNFREFTVLFRPDDLRL